MGSTFQFAHSGDNVAGDEHEPGAAKIDTSSDAEQVHALASFFDEILNLPVGSYTVINGKIVPKK